MKSYTRVLLCFFLIAHCNNIFCLKFFENATDYPVTVTVKTRMFNEVSHKYVDENRVFSIPAHGDLMPDIYSRYRVELEILEMTLMKDGVQVPVDLGRYRQCGAFGTTMDCWGPVLTIVPPWERSKSYKLVSFIQ